MIPSLYAIADLRHLDDDRLYITRLLRAGLKLIQLRAKSWSEEELFHFTSEVLALRNSVAADCRIIVNDSISITKRAGADGVHLGQTDASVSAAREVLGPDALIGLSTHNIDQVKAAPAQLLTYLGFGPIFASPSKSGHAPVTGLPALKEATAVSALPIVAIGGITSANASQVFAAGAASVAVISDLRSPGADMEQGRLEAKLQQFLEAAA